MIVIYFIENARKIPLKNLRGIFVLFSWSFFIFLLFCSDSYICDRYNLRLFLYLSYCVDSDDCDFSMRYDLIFLGINHDITHMERFTDMIDR
jgi:hypothetical protein